MKADRRRCGQALAEFALVLPVFLLLMLGVFDFGRVIFLHTSMTNGAREGARLATVNQDLSQIEARIEDQTAMIVPTISVNFFVPPDDPADPPTEACDAVPDVGCLVVVEVEGEFNAITPIIGSIIGPIDVSAATTSTVEFSCPTGLAGHPFQFVTACPKQP